MAMGLAGSFKILERSPHDLQSSFPEPLPQPAGALNWVPSRYNVRAKTEDGRLVLWNTYRGTMSVFGADQRSLVEMMIQKKGFSAPASEVVSYFEKRGFLIREGTDEYRRIQLGFGQEQYRSDVLELILLASEDCNFRCPYCYEDFARGTMLPEVRTGVKKLVEQRISSLSRLSISWFGGEPLYGFEALEDLAPFFVEIAERHSVRYDSIMTTNGYLLTPDVADKLLRWKINRFQITLDGPPECHDHTRPTRDGDGTFERIFENLKSMSQRPDPFQIDIRVNFDKNNHPKISGFLDLLSEAFEGDSRFRMRFRGVGKWGGKNDEELETCGLNAPDLELEMKKEAAEKGLGLADDIRQVKGMGAQVCYAARPYNFIVGASGQLMKCTVDLDKKDRNIVGHLGESGEFTIDEDKLALWTEPAFEKDTKCKKCVVLPVCQGIYCPQIRFDYDKSPCTPLRKNLKKELRATVQDSAQRARNQKIPIHDNLKRIAESSA